MAADVHGVLVPGRLHHPPLRRPLHLLRGLRQPHGRRGQEHRARVDGQLRRELRLGQRERRRRRGFQIAGKILPPLT